MNAIMLFENNRLVPVVTLDHADHAVPLAEVLLSAGIRAMEITLRTAAALQAIESVASQVPGLLVGAGSVRTPEQMQAVKKAGAAFAVSPGATQGLLAAAQDCRMPFVPGAATASEILALTEGGYELVKFFPAEINGGVAAIRALSAPLPEVQFFPTGGITAENVLDYLDIEAVRCVGGSWFVPPGCIQAQDFAKIESLAREAMRIILD